MWLFSPILIRYLLFFIWIKNALYSFSWIYLNRHDYYLQEKEFSNCELHLFEGQSALLCVSSEVEEVQASFRWSGLFITTLIMLNRSIWLSDVRTPQKTDFMLFSILFYFLYITNLFRNVIYIIIIIIIIYVIYMIIIPSILHLSTQTESVALS